MNKLQKFTQENSGSDSWGTELLRDDLFNLIFEDDTKSIMYWAGKELAQKYPIITIEDLPIFFEKSNWGTLEKKSESKNEIIFTLSGKYNELRISENDNPDFSLETGFLAESIQQIIEADTEAEFKIKKNMIEIRLVFDINEKRPNYNDNKPLIFER
ncbi:DUF2507 domain-containing protein [Lactobacillus sp. S2-2]|uniref:DUF2507 domain-containing protein n=1 Tax=Lactobacillus sp. S2-2 TaxID=2692917 RepID=UPI001F448E1D|nr:DUF2507 domain-containing protein [Lactobacillus sp. S2-2]MCF6515819.1 DUF2507 domain-containing protein [Lactobacillus sp. S2-2]